jgi:hypothetical protein
MLPRTRYRSIFWVGVLAALPSSGCDSKCSGTYDCPAGGGEVIVPAGLPAPVSVTADAPCWVGSTPPYTNRIYVNINGEETGACTVRASLSDGTQLVASLSFTPLMCCGLSAAGMSATFTIAHAGDAAAD